MEFEAFCSNSLRFPDFDPERGTIRRPSGRWWCSPPTARATCSGRCAAAASITESITRRGARGRIVMCVPQRAEAMRARLSLPSASAARAAEQAPASPSGRLAERRPCSQGARAGRMRSSVRSASREDERTLPSSPGGSTHHRGGGRVIDEPQLRAPPMPSFSFVALLRANGFPVAPSRPPRFSQRSSCRPRSPEDIRQAGLQRWRLR